MRRAVSELDKCGVALHGPLCGQDEEGVSLTAWEKSKRFTWDAHADVIREEMLRRRGLLRS